MSFYNYHNENVLGVTIHVCLNRILCLFTITITIMFQVLLAMSILRGFCVFFPLL